MGRPRKPSTHGTINNYKNRGCRCLPCKDAWRKYNRKYVREARSRIDAAKQYEEDRREQLRKLDDRQEGYIPYNE